VTPVRIHTTNLRRGTETWDAADLPQKRSSLQTKESQGLQGLNSFFVAGKNGPAKSEQNIGFVGKILDFGVGGQVSGGQTYSDLPNSPARETGGQFDPT
jgi:hypothetical protein